MEQKKPSQEQAALLVIAAANNDKEAIIKYRNEYGPDSIYTARDDVGHSILHAVCERGHIDLLNYILPPHVPSPPGPPPQNAPLFSSSLSPTPHLTQCLVDNETPDNRTPLHYASRKGNFECIKALLAYASTRLGSMDGSTYSKKELPKGANRAADAIEGRQKTAEHVLLGKKTSKGRLAEDEAEIAGYKDVKDFLNERRNKLNNNDDQQRRSIDIKDANEKIKSLNRNNDTNTLNNSTRGLFEPGNARKETENLFNSINN